MLVRSAVRTVANLFWVLYFKLLPSVGLLYAAFIPKAGEVKLDDRDWARARFLAPALSTTSFLIHRGVRGIGILRSTRLQAPPPEWALAHRAGV